jgi:Resolvase, N terminal domain
MNKPVTLDARVSPDRQKENHTIASQVSALTQYAETNGYVVPPEWQFQDDGYSGATLVRPGLEALRDLAEGEIQTVLIYSPDRLSRKYAYQVQLAEEFARDGVELIFLRAPSGATPEPVAGPVSRDDCGIRTGTDCRAFSPRQAAPRSAGLDQCAVGRPLRLPIRKENRYLGGLLRSRGVRGRGGTSDLRCLHAARPQQ